jgi:hypothetical protein
LSHFFYNLKIIVKSKLFKWLYWDLV